MKKLDIIYEDKFILAVNKPHNLLTISTDKEKDKTLYHEALTYIKKKNQKIFIVHRLDKDTSGIVLFAKNEKIKKYLQDNWSNVQRYYVALVEGKITAKGEIKSYLKETKTLLTYSAKEGKFAHTKYEPIMISNKCTLLNIQILTGRKNQIRVHMKDINHPIVGDQKYGSKIKSVKYLYLTANKVVFIHPITKKEINLEIDIPEESIIIIGLLHDICKTNFYKVDFRNAKNALGVWEKVPYYTIEDTIPYGHGEKSVMMITEYMKLTPEEKYSIRWHMGYTEPKENYNAIGASYTKYPIALLTHEADLEATYFYDT